MNLPELPKFTTTNNGNGKINDDNKVGLSSVRYQTIT